jgi:hypothetical protein
VYVAGQERKEKTDIIPKFLQQSAGRSDHPDQSENGFFREQDQKASSFL